VQDNSIKIISAPAYNTGRCRTTACSV